MSRTLLHISNPPIRHKEDVVSITADQTLTGADSGKVFFMNNTSGVAITLPAPEAGYNFKMMVGTAPTGSDNYVISSAAAGLIEGIAIVNGASVAGIAETNVNFIGGTAKVGDYIKFHCDGTTWYAEGMGRTAGGITFTT